MKEMENAFLSTTPALAGFGRDVGEVASELGKLGLSLGTRKSK